MDRSINGPPAGSGPSVRPSGPRVTGSSPDLVLGLFLRCRPTNCAPSGRPRLAETPSPCRLAGRRPGADTQNKEMWGCRGEDMRNGWDGTEGRCHAAGPPTAPPRLTGGGSARRWGESSAPWPTAAPVPSPHPLAPAWLAAFYAGLFCSGPIKKGAAETVGGPLGGLKNRSPPPTTPLPPLEWRCWLARRRSRTWGFVGINSRPESHDRVKAACCSTEISEIEARALRTHL